ncbi:MAG: sortase [Firmicutes bacterium]|nr:sortase [Bacillota bacterium]
MKLNKIIGVILIFLSVILINIYFAYTSFLEITKTKKVEQYYTTYVNGITDGVFDKEPSVTNTDKVEENYIAVLKIDKIGLEKGLYSKNNKKNNVKSNIEILESSDYPNVKNGNFILAAHSGNAKNAFFKDLDKLSLNDIVKVNYLGINYSYKVIRIYDVEKTGVINITRNINKDTLTLITCRQKTNNQIVIICEKI